jgi:hypothetical protein
MGAEEAIQAMKYTALKSVKLNMALIRKVLKQYAREDSKLTKKLTKKRR